MKRKMFGIVTVVALALLVVGIRASRPVPKVLAATCSNALLSGYYGAYSFGSVGQSGWDQVAVFFFDGVGSWNNDAWQMDGGNLGSGSANGSYSLGVSTNGGCQGTISFSGGSIRIVTASSGAEVYALQTSTGDNFIQVLKKQ